jgi:hypothetical protein
MLGLNLKCKLKLKPESRVGSTDINWFRSIVDFLPKSFLLFSTCLAERPHLFWIHKMRMLWCTHWEPWITMGYEKSANGSKRKVCVGVRHCILMASRPKPAPRLLGTPGQTWTSADPAEVCSKYAEDLLCSIWTQTYYMQLVSDHNTSEVVCCHWHGKDVTMMSQWNGALGCSCVI